jgi:small subunit ribosomal protein S16
MEVRFMAVHIRLQRFGAKKHPYYRIVAADARSPRDGRFLEQVGTYDPMASPANIRFKADRLDYWLGVGAAPTATTASLIRKFRRDNPVVEATEAVAEA